MAGKGYQKGPAAYYRCRSPVISNLNREFDENLTLGQKVADAVARVVGSWTFIIIQSILILIWMSMNLYLAYAVTFQSDFWRAWDPYPFILLNLVLSFQAAYTGPVVMMSQNRQAEKDRLMAEHDYTINRKAQEEIEVIMQHLVYHDGRLQEIMSRLDRLSADNHSGIGVKPTAGSET
ncbi:Hypothetical protein LUCI_0572 [Lucifera butyrica]|uniref:DUF1003 domain-containing protein n=1 Tax=Lucifera butyrica TaxID=1351585 RepID=A0A498R591_9FIRM|nr:DUF1003 domain-containing protein [Lucifera butyrica]VBB05363.1 Hypothetical protein LUCI_0572 [Lucifera butyrica]